MIVTDLNPLMAKLSTESKQTLESAIGLCMSYTHYEVSLEHWILKILEQKDSDFMAILKHYHVSVESMRQQLTHSLNEFDKGNSTRPSLAPELIQTIQQAWVVSSIHYGMGEITTGMILLAIISNRKILGQIRLDQCCSKISRNTLMREYIEICNDSDEYAKAIATASHSNTTNHNSENSNHAHDADILSLYCEDLLQKAQEGKLDPVYGREKEIDQMIDIFCRRRKNNPILVGDAGVGKTAVVEGLALRIIENDVPETLKNKSILSLDLALLEAGANVKGEFEKRLTSLIQAIQSSDKPIILFIDEAHRLLGKGDGGSSDIANILKPALSRGDLATVAATTWKEYKQYFEKDPAMTRRFQIVKLTPPDDATTLLILRGLKAQYQSSHNVEIRDDAIQMMVKTSSRYLTGKSQPDKAVDLLDTCSAKIKVSLSSMPSIISHKIKVSENLQREKEALLSDQSKGIQIDAKALELACSNLSNLQAEIKTLTTLWERQKNAVMRIQAALDTETRIQEKQHLDALQKDHVLIHYEVTPELVAEVVSAWTGIPLGNMLKDESNKLLELNTILKEEVMGQEDAINLIAEHLRLSKAGLKPSQQPLGVFLLAGPSGVGKTQTAQTIANTLFGGSSSLLSFNMSEFQEKHTISRLIGSPPGYVGFGEGGMLTEAVAKQPYSVVLLDEVEKASLDVMNLFYHVFDKGILVDSEGKEVDFSNTVIILTSNLATQEIMEYMQVRNEEGAAFNLAHLSAHIQPVLSHWFKPALLARMTTIPYQPLTSKAILAIVHLKISTLQKQLYTNNAIILEVALSTKEYLASLCIDPHSGARNIDHMIKLHILPQLADLILKAMCANRSISHISLAMNGEGLNIDCKYEIEAESKNKLKQVIPKSKNKK